MSDLILFRPEGGSITLHPEAERIKSEALETAALVGVVRDAATNETATSALKALKSAINLCEATRKVVKEPVLDLARLIDSTAKEYRAELDAEFNRISRASADWQTEQLERVRAQERARAEEAARLERERQEAERRAIEDRMAAERAAAVKAAQEAASARNEQERLVAEARAKAEQERIAAEAEARAKLEAERAAQAQLALPVVEAPTRADGQTAKPVWRFEVTDIWTLARAHPGLVEITPRRQEINDVIAALAQAGEPKIAGLRIWNEVKVGVRVGRGRVVDV